PRAGHELHEANYYEKVFFHKLGDAQSRDKLVYERKDEKEWGFAPVITDDGRFLVIYISVGTSHKNGLLIQDLKDAAGRLTLFLKPGTTMMAPIANEGTTFWMLTDDNAPRSRIVTVDLAKGLDVERKEIVKEADDALQSASLINNRLICLYLKHARSSVKIFSPQGQFVKELELPGLGTAAGFNGRQTDRDTYYSYASFNAPSVVRHLNLADFSQETFFAPKTSFNPDDYTTDQIFYNSKDGTKLPMFVCYKKGTQLNGNNPTYLYGYGGFRISLAPFYSPSNMMWMERGGIFAMPNLRGGSEYGEAWHEAGMKHNKQKVFDDFISAAETLIAKKYTSTKKLAIGGASNGGLLVGACLTQRPDLYGAAVPAVGVMDMLRFHKFTVGWEWTQEYGTPDDPEDFKTLFAYSPLHNIKKGVCYPPTLITTADHDDRVVPGHSFKFAATLQEAQGCPNPILIRIETKAGHGAGKSTTKQIEETADKWTFLSRVLNM
ncbi:MAG: prolyl oligopeptidase family serine peptidase, partial [Terriglobales bacterium]